MCHGSKLILVCLKVYKPAFLFSPVPDYHNESGTEENKNLNQNMSSTTDGDVAKKQTTE